MNRHAWAGMHEPACMLLLLLLRACVRAWSPPRPRDRHHVSARRKPRRGESNFRIEIFTNISGGQKDEFVGLPPELVLLTARNIREYFYTIVRKFDSPRLP
jgi:hypothetical protein